MSPLSPKEEAAALAEELVAAGAKQRQGLKALAGLGAAVGLAGAGLLAFEGHPIGPGLLVIGAFVAFLGVRGLAATVGMALRSGAANEVERGRFDVALALLDVLEARRFSGGMRRTARLLRGYVALVRGDAKRARVHLDDALAVPPPRWTVASLHRAEELQCRALRALAAAIDEDDATVAADVAVVRAAIADESFGRAVIVNEVWVRMLLARASLAEALVVSRTAGPGPELAALLEANRSVLVEGTVPRERALYRGLLRLSRERRRSAYREPPKQEKARDAPSPEAWVESLVPEVAAFLDRDRPPRRLASNGSAAAGPERSAAQAGRAATAPVRPKPVRGSRSRRTLLLWIFVACSSFATWQLLDRPRKRGGRVPVAPVTDPTWLLASLPVVFIATIAALLALRWRSVVKRARVSNRMMRQLALGQPIDVSSDGGASGASDLLTMLRHTALSRAAFAEARFEDALASADAAFAEAAAKSLVGEFQGMLAEARARALAAMGRGAEARGEVASWPKDYSHRASGAVAVELLAAVREEDEDAAYEVVARVNDELSLDVRTEALLDLLRAKRGAIGLVDRARLAEDVRRPDLRRFLTAVAPGLLADFEKESAASSEVVAADADVEAETEVESEAEAAEAQGTTARIDRR